VFNSFSVACGTNLIKVAHLAPGGLADPRPFASVPSPAGQAAVGWARWGAAARPPSAGRWRRGGGLAELKRHSPR